MRLKPKSTVKNPRAMVFRRFNGVQTAIEIGAIYKTTANDNSTQYWFYNPEKHNFEEYVGDTTENAVITITTSETMLKYENTYYKWNGAEWAIPQNIRGEFTNIDTGLVAKYQFNRYFYSGSFDYMVKGSIEGATTQFIKGNIIPLTSLNIKHFNDYINLQVDDLVVIEGRLYAVENPETVRKMMPKSYNVYFATLNSIL